MNIRLMLSSLTFILLLNWPLIAAAENSVTDHATLHKGFFNFYVDNKTADIYLKISAFNQPFIFQSSLPYGVGSNDIGLDRGQLGDTRLVQFERVGNKVLLKQMHSYYRANTDNLLEQQPVEQAFASSILWGFQVKQVLADNSVLINYTPFLLSDIHHIQQTLQQQQQGNFSVDTSRSAVYLPRTKSFAENTELEAIVTYKGSNAGDYLKQVTPDATAFTVHLHHSLVKLPDNQYQPRAFHPESGFWSMSYADYATAFDQPLVKRVIPRHRLQKKNPLVQHSEAVEPIVYYIDSAVPEPIRSALIEGASWWNQAFDAIGFKDAFQVKILPADADPMDIRYNVIQWVHRATRGWSYGASVIDPRTGEIIKGHVTLGSLRVRQDYLLAQALTSPFVQRNADTSALKAMALARIKQLAAHEVGHTLGIAHNFAASMNQRASVMDYPHPLIQLTDKGIDLSSAYAQGIGAWDKQVIAYGYSQFEPSEEASQLQAILQQSKQLGLRYLSDPDARPADSASPIAHLWDNHDNAIAELEHLNKIRAYALTHFGQGSIAPNTPWSELDKVLVPLYHLTRYQITAVAKLIAGVDYDYQVKQTEDYPRLQVVVPEQQHQALQQLLQTLTPEYLLLPEHIIQLIPPAAYGYGRDRESSPVKTGLTFDWVTMAEAQTGFVVDLLLNPQRLARLAQQQAVQPKQLSVNQLFDELMTSTLAVPPIAEPRLWLIQQRINQVIVHKIIALWQNPQVVSEVQAEVLAQLSTIEKLLAKQAKRAMLTDAQRAHYHYLKQQITQAMSKVATAEKQPIAPLPPGSPIGQ